MSSTFVCKIGQLTKIPSCDPACVRVQFQLPDIECASVLQVSTTDAVAAAAPMSLICYVHQYQSNRVTQGSWRYVV